MEDVVIYAVLGVIVLLGLIMAMKLKNKKVRLLCGVIASLVIAFVCIFSFNPLLSAINYGLDLQGGFEVLYQISSISDEDELDSDMVYNTYKALLKRIDILGVSEPEITIEGDDQIRVKLAGVTNKEEAREVLSVTASLTFRDVNDNLLMTSEVLNGNAKVTADQYGNPAVSLSIKDNDTFYEVTNKVSKMTNNVIVIWLDYDEETDSYDDEKDSCGSLSNSHCLSAATVSQGFSSDVIITGNFTDEEASSLVELINSGALPTKLEEISSRTVEASYGEASLNQTLIAGAIGICGVIVIMIVCYHFAGLLAGIGVLIYTCLSFLCFYLINGVLTLPGIAAMLLGIGMAVDANVISFERIKEQLKIGVSLKEAFQIGNKKSLTSIMDSNITTMIVAVVLFIFGESSVKGFATMLIISIIVTVFVMVVLIKFLTGLFVKIGFFDDKLNLFIGVKKRDIIPADEVRIPYQKLDFVKRKKFFLGATVLIILVGSVVSFVRGANLGVEFTGGTTITVKVQDDITIDSLMSDIDDLDYTIKKTESTDEDLSVTIDEVLDKDGIQELTSILDEKYTDTNIYTVSKVVKQELVKNAVYSVIIAFIGILIYVGFRFKFNYALSAIVALLHDIIIVILFFLVFQLEITSMFIAAVLTIIGYSINDTIVTFDMIRAIYAKKKKDKEILANEKKKEMRKIGKKADKKKENDLSLLFTADDLEDVVNDSLRITFFRSILTTVTTIFPVICLMILGAREIVNFNIALLVGFVAGVYSSIFIASQIWFILELRGMRKKPKTSNKDNDDEIDEVKVKGVNC